MMTPVPDGVSLDDLLNSGFCYILLDWRGKRRYRRYVNKRDRNGLRKGYNIETETVVVSINPYVERAKRLGGMIGHPNDVGVWFNVTIYKTRGGQRKAGFYATELFRTEAERNLYVLRTVESFGRSYSDAYSESEEGAVFPLS